MACCISIYLLSFSFSIHFILLREAVQTACEHPFHGISIKCQTLMLNIEYRWKVKVNQQNQRQKEKREKKTKQMFAMETNVKNISGEYKSLHRQHIRNDSKEQHEGFVKNTINDHKQSIYFDFIFSTHCFPLVNSVPCYLTHQNKTFYHIKSEIACIPCTIYLFVRVCMLFFLPRFHSKSTDSRLFVRWKRMREKSKHIWK